MAVNPACACGSPRTVRHGPESGSHLRLSAGRAELVPGTYPRFLCKGCGRTFTRRPPEVEADERAVRDRAAELAFAHGRAPAARSLGVGVTVLGTLLDDWVAGREPDTLDAAPDFVLAQGVRIRNADWILVADVDRESLVQAVPDLDGLSAWLMRPGPLPPLRACVPVDPALAEAVRRCLPEAILMVAPAAALRAIRGALAAGLRILRRSPGMRGRNAFPSTARFLRAVEGDPSDRSGWPREATALVAAGRIAREIAEAPDAPRAHALWPQMELACATPGGQPLARLMATWRAPILAGLAHRFVDRIARDMDRIRRAAQARRPSIVFQDFRGLVLLRDYERITLPARRGRAQSGTVGSGRPLTGLLEALGERPDGLLRALDVQPGA